MLAKCLTVAALVGATGGCAALPALEAGGALLSGIANFDAFREKIASLLHGSDPTATAKAASAPQLIADGDVARAQGDDGTAAWYYAEAAAADPKSKEAQLRLGGEQLALENDAGALIAYHTALTLDPKNGEAALRLGEVELARADTSDALVHLSTALRNQQNDPKVYNAMGVAFAMEGKYALAKQSFDAGLALKPGYPALLNNYGLMQLQSGDLQAALNTFSTLVETANDNERYRTNRALVEVALGDTAAALHDAPNMDEAGLRRMLARYTETATAAVIHIEAPALGAQQEAALPTAFGAVRAPLPPRQVSQNDRHPLRGVD